MAQLKDLIVNGASRLIGDAFTNKITISTLADSTGSTGSNGQVLQTSGANISWATLGGAASKGVTDSTSASAIGTGTSLPTERDIYYGLPTINNAHNYTSNTTIYAPTAGGTADTQALVGNGATTAPKWVNISPSISITAGDGSNAPKINVTVLGRSGTAQAITTASTSAYGVTKLYNGVDSTSTTLAATANAVKTAYDKANGIVAAADAMVFKGVLNGASSTTYTPAADRGHTYKVNTAGLINGEQVETGDILICTTDSTAAATSSNVSTIKANWVIVQNNIDGAVYRGANTFTDANIIIADSTAGKVKSSGKTITATTPASGATDSTIPTSKAVWAAIDALDGNLNNTTAGAGKTLTAFSQTNGQVSATFGDISISKSQISDFPTTMTPASHSHGNITNDGKITTTATIANGDKLVIVDSDSTAGSKITGSSITFDGSTTTKALTQKGTWETFNNYSHPTGDGNKHVPANGTTNNSKFLQATATAGTYQWANAVTSVTAGTGLNTSADQADSATKGSITTTGTLYLTTSGVTANTYGNTSQQTPSHGGTFNIPYFTVDKYGRITAANTTTVKLPADNNTDTKVTQGTTTTTSWRKVLLNGASGTTYAAWNTEVGNDVTDITYRSIGVSVQPSTNTLKANNINAARAFKNLITGTGTAGSDAGSGDNRYKPARWTFNTGTNAADGEIYTIKIPVAGHDYGVFMSVDNGTNYYPVVLNGTGRITTHYGNGTYLQVIFEPTGSASSMFPLAGGTARETISNGVFRVINYYDTNSNYGYTLRTIYPNIKAGSNKIFPYTLIMQNKDGRWESLVTSASNGTSKAKNTHGFLLNEVWAMYANVTYNENANVGTYNIYTRYTDLLDARYSFNVSTSSGFTGYKPIYLVGTIGTDGLFYLADSWWTQTLPTTDDGKIYIYLGDAYDTYRMTLHEINTAFIFRDSRIQIYDARGIKTITRSGTTFTVTRDDGSTFTFTQQDNNTTSFTITANATDGIWDLTGTNGTNAVTYAVAPYSTQQSKLSFDTSTTNPSRTDRLNLNGYLYATKLYSGGNEVLTSHQSLSGYIPKSTLSGAYDIMYSSAANTPTRLAANTTTTKKFLRMTGTGSAGAAPAWDTVTNSDVGLGNVTNDAQIPKSIGTTKGDIIYWSAANTPARLGIGSTGKVLKVANGIPSWGDITIPYGETLPSTGNAGDVFLQTSAEYYELPTGGSTGRLLMKRSTTDRDVQWTNNVYVSNDVLFGAAWNDYAEYRECLPNEFPKAGNCVIETGEDSLQLSTQRMQPGAEIVSDTFGFAIGKTNKATLPIAVSGRVLAYTYEDREEFKKNIGKPVCSGPNGTVSIMTDEEYRNYGYCAIGTISSIPNYETWGENNIKVDNRVWIKVR